MKVTLLKCQGNPCKDQGYLIHQRAEFKRDDPIYTIYPNCNLLKDQVCDKSKVFGRGKIVQLNELGGKYNHKALDGSGGAPVFSERTHELIGLQGKSTDGQGLVSLTKISGMIKKYGKSYEDFGSKEMEVMPSSASTIRMLKEGLKVRKRAIYDSDLERRHFELSL